MADNNAKPSGPDLTQGVDLAEIPDGGSFIGRVGEEEVLLIRQGKDVFAIGAHCSHYHGPLAEGLVVGKTVRCPWHHAAFDLETGEAIRAPALSPVTCWSVKQASGKVIVQSKKEPAQAKPPRKLFSKLPKKIVIVGGGAAGFAAAERLRRAGYQDGIVMLSADDAAPVDRPNLSKDYLAGSAPEDWVPLRPDSYYAENGIDLKLKSNVVRIDPRAKEVETADKTRHGYDRLLLATGAEPVRLAFPGSDQPHVHTLRSLADCRAIIKGAASGKKSVVLGASFIGLEVAASLLARGMEVHVVAPEKTPMEKVLGPQLGDFVRKLHEEKGVHFHLENTVTAITGRSATLKNGGTLDADLVVMGVGVRPRISLAEQAGLTIDKGVVVNPQLETSAPNIFAAGDIARWPDPHSGEKIRVEHWVVAERQGQTAALNMLGENEKHDLVPFFWSQHYDVPINYVGHAESWDEIKVDGDIAGKDCMVHFKRKGKLLAAASIYRDLESLKEEVKMEKVVAA